MNFNKLLAVCCAISALTIFVSYFINHYESLDKFSASIQRVVIGISSIGGIGFLAVLISKFKQLMGKNYIYTTVILALITGLSMWLNYFLYVKI